MEHLRSHPVREEDAHLSLLTKARTDSWNGRKSILITNDLGVRKARKKEETEF